MLVHFLKLSRFARESPTTRPRPPFPSTDVSRSVRTWNRRRILRPFFSFSLYSDDDRPTALGSQRYICAETRRAQRANETPPISTVDHHNLRHDLRSVECDSYQEEKLELTACLLLLPGIQHVNLTVCVWKPQLATASLRALP